MDKIATYKDSIYKEAMALSNRAFEGARQGLMRSIRGAAGNNKVYTQKILPTKEALDVARRQVNNLADKAVVYNPLKKYRINFDRNEKLKQALIAKGNADELTLRGLGQLHRTMQRDSVKGIQPGRAFYNSFSNAIVANPSNTATFAHEAGHAKSRITGKSLPEIFEKASKGEQLYKPFGGSDHDEVSKFMQNAFFLGGANKNSKSVGRKMMGAYREAVKNGDEGVLQEFLANARSYNSIAKFKGAAKADEALDSILSAQLSYLGNSEGDKAVDAFEKIVYKPFRGKGGKKIDAGRGLRRVYRPFNGSYAEFEHAAKMRQPR